MTNNDNNNKNKKNNHNNIFLGLWLNWTSSSFLLFLIFFLTQTIPRAAFARSDGKWPPHGFKIADVALKLVIGRSEKTKITEKLVTNVATSSK